MSAVLFRRYFQLVSLIAFAVFAVIGIIMEGAKRRNAFTVCMTVAMLAMSAFIISYVTVF